MDIDVVIDRHREAAVAMVSPSIPYMDIKKKTRRPHDECYEVELGGMSTLKASKRKRQGH